LVKMGTCYWILIFPLDWGIFVSYILYKRKYYV